MANKLKYGKRALMLAIRGDPGLLFVPPGDDDVEALWVDDPRQSSHGHVPTIAKRLDCSEQTVRNYVGRGSMLAADVRAAIAEEKRRGEVERADYRYDLISAAEKGLMMHVKALNLQAIKFALERLDKDNYSARNEMTGADGDALFDGETMKLLDEMGVDVREALAAAGQALKVKLLAARGGV